MYHLMDYDILQHSGVEIISSAYSKIAFPAERMPRVAQARMTE